MLRAASFLPLRCPRWFLHKDVTQNTKDGNPGTANAFLQGGPVCGTAVLLCDLLKGRAASVAVRQGAESPVAVVRAGARCTGVWPRAFLPVSGTGRQVHRRFLRRAAGAVAVVAAACFARCFLHYVFYSYKSAGPRPPHHPELCLLDGLGCIVCARGQYCTAPALALRPLSCAGISSRSGRSNGKTQPARDEYMDAKEAVAKQAIACFATASFAFLPLGSNGGEKPREETHFPG